MPDRLFNARLPHVERPPPYPPPPPLLASTRPSPPQNGIASALSSHFLKNRPLLWTRLALIPLNVVLIVLGSKPTAYLRDNLDNSVLQVGGWFGGRVSGNGALEERRCLRKCVLNGPVPTGYEDC